jgi:hypothetical protein
MDEAVAQFTAVTGLDTEKAQQYLQFSDGNVETAIQLYFESPDLGDAPAHGSQRPTGSATPHHGNTSAPTDDAGVVHIDSDEDGSDFEAASATYESRNAGSGAGHAAGHPAAEPSTLGDTLEDDEAMARRLQEEMYAGADMGSGFDVDGVRAPMARTTETLVGPESTWDESDDMRASVLDQLRAREAVRGTYNLLPFSRLFLFK